MNLDHLILVLMVRNIFLAVHMIFLSFTAQIME